MSANKSKHTSPEVILRKSLRRMGIAGYSLHSSTIPGHPDIVYSKQKFAIFVHGCYWHHCPKCDFPIPKHNREFWKAKFARNQERDKRKISELKKAGWNALVIWEHEIKKDASRAAQKVKRKLDTLQ